MPGVAFEDEVRQPRELVLFFLGLQSHGVVQVRAVVAPAQQQATSNAQLGLDIALHALVAVAVNAMMGTEGNLQLQVVWAELVAPLRATVCLVNRDQSEPVRFESMLQLDITILLLAKNSGVTYTNVTLPAPRAFNVSFRSSLSMSELSMRASTPLARMPRTWSWINASRGEITNTDPWDATPFESLDHNTAGNW
eukprot:CAMPEP_0177529970 /NCGR_PEP_ID=MMETSP0369-20130122/53122_1 /TAXON_ID=447022 ORGANISM="Scrippsiella hangoei-like, Strain SHHI-4" /NCGR_SAMPLE_ID=MMETSP0369 /ASSEMBLY_ACC=CAM_ASM_000364 /LENGTH=194 /DNA_ID=CAMNT_0019010739 /DNA_START=55 /DNA_END=641 /DNA_ORIENTATION=+